MAATKINGMLGSKSFISNNYFLCNSTPSLKLWERKAVHVRKVMAVAGAPMLTKLIELDFVRSILNPKTPTQSTLSGQVTVGYDAKEKMKELMFQWWDSSNAAIDARRGVSLQLVSSEVDPRTGKPKVSKEAIIEWSRDLNISADKFITYNVQFLVDTNFGAPGAILVTNRNEKELFLKNVTIEDSLHFDCESWVQPENLQSEKRIFFSNKAFLPSETPEGLKELRKKELSELRGNGVGVRVSSDRTYDYDVYNDLGDPDKGTKSARPVLGGERRPYPRRCRTGRPSTKSDPKSEAQADESMPMYVPRDEAFGDVKRETVDAGSRNAMMNNLFPFLKHTTEGEAVSSFTDINNLYKQCRNHSHLNKIIKESTADAFKFDPPYIVSRDASCCLRDDEFGRLTLAGMNPLSIERLHVFPPVSKLEASVYGPQESAFREEHIITHLGGMSVQEAIEKKKLFVLDYHDAYLPFLNSINAHPDRKAYATRTIFFLTQLGTLKPIAIVIPLI
ncbi:lipoxygenase 3, Arabidopsis thaliana lipoxygenase 3 [Hibiscus trionum]|uniref:Lipoxygenase 3, Arabidopsis thaliana lipoxygenase 3 n=1 Tax=Hibiscus trionum TaxID=183268 RepID=A0A9W7JI55_HIBTR|nr:lipoxygenase 3, Arabidopsis thaliana lipoxygenase 3 [Hibiscus trionum]